jgi:hypothetical protein
MRALCICTLLLFSTTAFAQNVGGRFLLEGFNNSSSKYDGHVLRGSVGYAIPETADVEVGFDDLNRTYPGDVQVKDTALSVDAVTRLDKAFYLESFYSKSTTADIYSIWTAKTGLHYTGNHGDIGLTAKYDEFRKSIAGSLIPSYFYSFSDEVGVGAAVFAVRTDTTSLAVQLQALYKIFHRHTFRVVGAGGQAIEDAGLIADFRSITTRYVYDVNDHWQVGGTLVDYWSTVRNEKSIGLSLGYR